jgi:HK97 family phage major capsid protein
VFVKSQGWKSVADPASRGQQWSTGPVEVSKVALSMKGTLLEGAGAPGAGTGAGRLPAPQVAPGVVSKLFEPLGVGDVFATAQATTNTVRYIIEGTATNAAAGVAEGGTKPESTIGASTVDEPVKKIATLLPVSDELLEDGVQIQQYLNGRLSLFVKMEEERQLLRGAGTNELVGLFGRSGINTYTKLAADDNAVALAKVLANTAGSSFLQPDTIIMHPTNWLSTRLLRDGTGGTVGQFYGGGPFTSAYGGGAADVGLFGASLWNTRAVLSSVVGAGTALVGNFGQAAQVWRKGGLSVEASNCHSNYFQVNLVALRAEERLAWRSTARPRSRPCRGSPRTSFGASPPLLVGALRTHSSEWSTWAGPESLHSPAPPNQRRRRGTHPGTHGDPLPRLATQPRRRRPSPRAVGIPGGARTPRTRLARNQVRGERRHELVVDTSSRARARPQPANGKPRGTRELKCADLRACKREDNPGVGGGSRMATRSPYDRRVTRLQEHFGSEIESEWRGVFQCR